ncbi:MAG: GFA family protein [Hyphomicrobiales bacterium]|nr:GFA family protein [Hyphomicrobiales bacterium]
MADTHDGGCLCGRVRFRAEGRPNNVTNCHCRLCQRQGGAAYVTWAEFPAARVTWLGDDPTWYRSSDTGERGFCPTCGATLTFRYVGGADVDLASVAFDDGDAFPPGDELWTQSERAWTSAQGHLPRHARGRADG